MVQNYKNMHKHRCGMKRGRPAFSQIRQRIVEILYVLGKSYGYEIYRIYLAVFPAISMRSIYYQLRRGVELGELEIDEITREQGEYSWGGEAEKIYYKLGPNANPQADERVRTYIEQHPSLFKLPEES